MPRVSEEHRELRRAQVLLAARRCFHRNGFHATTMDDIIREAGLSAGAVYRYFPSKDSLIVEAASEALAAIGSAVEGLLAADEVPPPLEAFAALIARIDQQIEGDGYDNARLALHGWAETARNPQLRALVGARYETFAEQAGELIVRWQRAGLAAPGLDPRAVGASMLSLMVGYVVQHAVTGGPDPAAYAAGVGQLLGAGAPLTAAAVAAPTPPATPAGR